ncbi:hypothetical protein C8J56DRAFT_892084 [Mycena floridula]|nr:hypothetical protein C8J56DRAFT_892084 [Mycena floridula]
MIYSWSNNSTASGYFSKRCHGANMMQGTERGHSLELFCTLFQVNPTISVVKWSLLPQGVAFKYYVSNDIYATELVGLIPTALIQEKTLLTLLVFTPHLMSAIIPQCDVQWQHSPGHHTITHAKQELSSI